MAKVSPSSLDFLFLASTIGRYFSFELLHDVFTARPLAERKTYSMLVKVLNTLITGGILSIEKNGAKEQADTIIFFSSQATQL